MKRRYSAEQMCDRIARLRSVLPQLVISADVMVGFPTELDEHFKDTVSALHEMQIAFPHVFSYSERDGTPAARIPASKQVPVEIRKQRNKTIRKQGLQIKSELLESRIGQKAYVLPEQQAKRDGYMMCRAEDYLAVLVPENMVQQGCWQQVCYESIQDGYLIAKNTV